MMCFRYTTVIAFFIVLNINMAFTGQYFQITGNLTDIDTSLYKHLKVTELSYHPKDLISGSDTIPGKYYEFIEFKNTGSDAIDLTGLILDSAVYYEFPSGYFLQPGAFYVIATKTRYFYEKYGVAASGNCRNYFDNAGEYILLRNNAGEKIFSFTYDDHIPWPEQADGGGYTLTSHEKNPTGDPNDYSYWVASSVEGGSPFSDDNGPSDIQSFTEMTGQFNFFIYPNPTGRFLHIVKKSVATDKAELKIFGSNGLLLYDSFFNNDIMVDFNEVSPCSGLYIVFIIENGNIQIEKVFYSPF